jgi:hypothetical protein
LERYCIALTKPRKQVIFASFCDNIINPETKHLKYLFHAHYMMLDILIQVNEGIAKFFTLLLEGPLEQNYGIKMKYMHHQVGYLHSLEIGKGIA